MKPTLATLIQQAQNAQYNEFNKLNYKKDSLKFLKEVAANLGLVKGSFDVRFNPGGIAGSGDSILHSEGLYLHLNDFGFYWRTVAGRKDYTGGYNRQAKISLDSKGLADLIKETGVPIK